MLSKIPFFSVFGIKYLLEFYLFMASYVSFKSSQRDKFLGKKNFFLHMHFEGNKVSAQN